MPQVKFVHITQDLDVGKDRTFEKLHSLAGNLYLRKKYATQSQVQEYDALIKDFDLYPKVRKQFDSMSQNLNRNNLLKGEDYDEFFVGTEYAEHRW